MVNSSLISVPSEIDQDKLQGAIDEALAPHQENAEPNALTESMQNIQARIQNGEFGQPAAPHQTFDVNFTVGQAQLGEDGVDWHVNFTWHWG